jgi:hypothetical protein
MKKLLTGALAVSLLASLAISASAIADEERTDVTVYANTPTIDGVINDGEWDKDNALDVNADNAMLWVQKMNEIQSRVREIIYSEIIYA